VLFAENSQIKGGSPLNKKLSPMSVLFLVIAFIAGFVLRPLAAPAPQEPEVPPPTTFTWTFQMHGTSAHPVFPLYQQWAEDIKQMSGGRLTITIHPVGTAVPLMESLGAVTTGTLDGAIMWGPFWRGVDPILALACGQTAGMTALEFGTWLHTYGGMELIREAYARHNIHFLPAIPIPAETFLWAHRPIRTVADLQGLKLRAAGFSLDAFTAMGAAATFMPGGETPPALLKRVIDAGEFGALVQDMAMGFHDSARYAMVGPRAPVIYDDVLINADKWKALPPELQNLVTNTLWRHSLTGHSHLLRLDQEAIATAKQRGTVFVPVSDDLMNRFRSTLDGILDTQAAGNANFAKVWESQRAFRDSFRQFRNTLYPWE